MRAKLTFHNILVLLICAMAIAGCRNEKNKIHATCFDGVQNQGELRADCGGPNCPECLPTCTDGIRNGDETGVDCGGPDCEPCATCDDAIKNAHWIPNPNLTDADLSRADVGVDENGVLYQLVMETNIDCGYPCPACEPTCNDGIMNNGEYGIDCVKAGGDAECPTCNPALLCTDGIQDGSETGVDCGDLDGYCPACEPATCNDGIKNVHIMLTDEAELGYIVIYEAGIDCVTNPATAEITGCAVCPIGTCFDGVLNQNETAIDCGGACGDCPEETSCSNGVKDGNEDGVDCVTGGSDTCPPCPACNDGIVNGPEELDPITQEPCIPFPIPPDYPYPGYETCPICTSCYDGVQNQNETEVDCGGPNCAPCNTMVAFQSISKPPADQGSVMISSAFLDQHSLNETILSGDTLHVDNPVTVTRSGSVVTVVAIQQVDAGEAGIFERKITIKFSPEGLTEGTAYAIEEAPQIAVPGSTPTPVVTYTQRFIPSNPNYTSFEYRSMRYEQPEQSDFTEYLAPPPNGVSGVNPGNSEMTITYHVPASIDNGKGRIIGTIDKVVLQANPYVCFNCGAPKYLLIQNIAFEVNYPLF